MSFTNLAWGLRLVLAAIIAAIILSQAALSLRTGHELEVCIAVGVAVELMREGK